jgi:hypothetical protein
MQCQWGVFQKGGVLLCDSVRPKAKMAQEAFLKANGEQRWRVLEGLGYRLRPLTKEQADCARAQRKRLREEKARLLAEPGFDLPRHEHEQQNHDVTKLLVAQFKAYFKPNHGVVPNQRSAALPTRNDVRR